MSLLNDWLVGSREIPMAKAASYLKELCRPAVPPPLPERTPLVIEGQVKIASIVMNHGVEALPELERQALVDPAVNAALDFEQAKAENAELQQQLETSQAQLAMATQQAQMAEQQAQEAAQAQEELEGQVEQDQQEKQMLQEQALNAQEASLSERVQTMEQREQLAMAASQLKEQLQSMAEGVGQLRAQAAGPPPGPAPEPVPQPDPTAPADVRKEQEQAQKAELEAEQQKAQAEMKGEQAAVEQAVETEEGMAEGGVEPPPAPPMEEEMAPEGPGAPVAGAPQVPTPAGGALKMGAEKVAAGSTTVELPMSQYPKAPAKDVLDGAAPLKLPSAGRVIPAIKKLTDESSRLDSAVDKEQLKPDENPELEKKEDPDLKEKQASMWSDTPARLWLAKVGAADIPVEELADQLKMLSTDELQELFSSLAEDPSGEQVTVARKRAMTIPSEGPAQGEEEYSVAMDGDEVARRAAALGLPKQAFAPTNFLPAGVLESALLGGVRGAAVGGVTGGVGRGIAHRGEGFEQAALEAGKGALSGAAAGGAIGALGGAVSPRLQAKALQGVPKFDAMRGTAIPAQERKVRADVTRGRVLKAISDTPGLLAGLLAGAKGPEAVEALVSKKEKEGSALHPRLVALLEKEAEVSPEFKQKHDREVLDIAYRLGRGVGSRKGARIGTWTGGLAGAGLGGAALRKAPGGRLGGALIGATIGGLTGRAAGAGTGAAVGGMKGRRLAAKTLPLTAPEEYEARQQLQEETKRIAGGKKDTKALSDARLRLAASKAITLQNIRDARARGEL